MLCIAGTIIAPVSYFILDSIPITVTGFSALIIGFTCIALANARPYISPEACQLLLKTGMENTAALLEELGLKNKAIYLPSALRDGHPQALIPLKEDEVIQKVKARIPGRLIVRYGNLPADMAIAVTTPGSMSIDILESRPGPTPGEIESAVTYVLSGVLDIVDSVSVRFNDSQVIADVTNPGLTYEDVWYYRCLGSPIASILAAITSEALGKPIRIMEETFRRGKGRIVLEVIS